MTEKTGLEAEKASLEAEKAVLEAKHQAKVESLEDANYASFEDGFDEAVAQVKCFKKEVSIDFSLVDQEKRLNEILRQQSSAKGVLCSGNEFDIFFFAFIVIVFLF